MKNLPAIIVLLLTSLAPAHADDGALNEVIVYSEGPDGEQPALDHYRAPRGEQAMARGAALWVPGINVRRRQDIFDVVFVESNDKATLVFASKSFPRTTLPLVYASYLIDTDRFGFEERPNQRLLVRYTTMIYTKEIGTLTEAYLLAWDHARHRPVVEKRWYGPDHKAPKWAVMQ